MKTKAEKRAERELAKNPPVRKTEMFTCRVTAEQMRYLKYASEELAAILGKNTHEISAGYVALMMMELGKERYEEYVMQLQKGQAG